MSFDYSSSLSAPRVLIVTAAFGDGHNSAARNLQAALSAQGCIVRVRDYLQEAHPETNAKLVKFYRWAITHFPKGWSQLYSLAARARFERSTINYFTRATRRMRRSLAHWQPDIIVSTYPLYPFLLDRLQRKGRLPQIPLYTVVTDSISINPVWFRAPSCAYFVTDELSREVLIRAGLKAERIFATGFPVAPIFAELNLRSTTPELPSPCRILYLPTGKRSHAEQILASLAEVKHPLELTIVMGRQEDRLRPLLTELQWLLPYPVDLIGWSTQVPELMASHHLGIAKAGGATVHEARAAQLPLLLNYVVPGQEEGNAELLMRQNCGLVLSELSQAGQQVENLLAQEARGLQSLRQELARVSRPQAAEVIAQHILSEYEQKTLGYAHDQR